MTFSPSDRRLSYFDRGARFGFRTASRAQASGLSFALPFGAAPEDAGTRVLLASMKASRSASSNITGRPGIYGSFPARRSLLIFSVLHLNISAASCSVMSFKRGPFAQCCDVVLLSLLKHLAYVKILILYGFVAFVDRR